jgi:ParB-like chromosome segregation protein Spo0J
MFTTKRYEYMPFDNIQIHPFISNHRPFELDKVAHYERDILKNGLLEPLIIWERKHGEYFMVGGFHRLAAIKAIREKHPGYFDYVDARVVSGEIDEMRALNLKLNADRLDTRITDYFDTVVYLNNANWDKERIAEFLDRNVSWVEEIIRFAPRMDPRLRKMLQEGKVSWNKAKAICRDMLAVPREKEKEVADKLIEELNKREGSKRPKRRPLSLKKAISRLTKQFEKDPKKSYTVAVADLLSLFMVMGGKEYTESHLVRVRKTFPGLVD